MTTHALRSNTALRLEQVRPWLEGNKVLDIGAGHGTLHGRVREIAASTVGLERDPELVEEARTTGLDVRLGDAQAFDLGERFDVVMAGELIEHLACPGGLLDSVRKHLPPEGHLVLTTPNAFAVTNFLRRLGSKPVQVNEEHVAWYCHATLTALLERHGFAVVEMGYLSHRTPGRVRRIVATTVRACLPDRLSSNTIWAVARPA